METLAPPVAPSGMISNARQTGGMMRNFKQTFLGECYKDKEYIGDLHRADGGYQVLRVEYGRGLSESPVMPAAAFRRSGGLQLTASLYVNHYEQIASRSVVP